MVVSSDGIVCAAVGANGLTFRCRVAGEDGERGDVLLLHGFPFWSSMFDPLMRDLARLGYRCVAFDQRGYSPGAAPEDESDYHYGNLIDDLFAVAVAVGFGKFHVVGHDHGAMLGWCAAGTDRGREHVASLTALSLPHPDAFSDGLVGAAADLEQQMRSQYFSVFCLPGSASRRCKLLYYLVGKPAGFASPKDFQKALWWYNGLFEPGFLSRPPTMRAGTLCRGRAYFSAVLRLVFGGIADSGVAQKKRLGSITMPALYICGTQDRFILGSKPFALMTREYCVGGYACLFPNIGHDIEEKTGCWYKEVVDAILEHIQGVTNS